MTHRPHGYWFSRNRNERWHRRLRQLRQMRAAKARKRQERIAAGWTPEPKMERWHRFEFGVRDKSTGETGWHDLVSVRHAAKALGLILKYA